MFLKNKKMKSYQLISYVFMVFFIFSCREKKLPEDSIEDNKPIFTFAANIGGIPVNLEAGKDNYYLYSNYNVDVNLNTDPTQFVGAIKQSNCNVCPNSLEIQFVNTFAFANQGMNYIDSVLKIDNAYTYFKGIVNATSYSVKFKATPRISLGGNITGYLWEFGDGTTSMLANPTHVYASSGNYNVSLTLSSNVFGTSKVTNQLKVGQSATVNTAKIIKDFWLGTNKLKFFHTNTGVAPFQYFWDFGDGTTSASFEPIHQYVGTPSKYNVKLRVIDANADTAYSEYNTKMDAATGVLSNFVIESSMANSFKASRVIVKWTDANGLVYTSNHSLQPNASNFEIAALENFVTNESGQATKKVRVKFNCKVYNGSQSLDIVNADVVIAVAYK
jgi:PKD repeat protein